MTGAPTSIADAVQVAADRLIRAEKLGVPCAPVRDLIGPVDVEVAYAVQSQVGKVRRAAGARAVGRKIGLTSEAVQEQLGVNQPDFGFLYDDMAYADGNVIPTGRLLQPRIEAEIAFVLGMDLADGDLALDQVASAVDYAVAALEIVDSRIEAWDISFADTVADNASAGLFALGTERRSLHDFVPREAGMTMSVTDEDDSSGTGAACLGDPVLALQWLARRARDLGTPLRAGEVVLSGALGPMRPVRPGTVATAAIDGLGTITVSFS